MGRELPALLSLSAWLPPKDWKFDGVGLHKTFEVVLMLEELSADLTNVQRQTFQEFNMEKEHHSHVLYDDSQSYLPTFLKGITGH